MTFSEIIPLIAAAAALGLTAYAFIGDWLWPPRPPPPPVPNTPNQEIIGTIVTVGFWYWLLG